MKIAKRYRPEIVASRDIDRASITDPYLDTKAERLVATDGRMLVAIPVETEKSERSRYLACSLLKAARNLGDDEVPAEIEDQEIVEYGVLWPAAQERMFPDWQSVVPKMKHGDPGTVTVHLNPRLLKSLAEAMASGSAVALTFDAGQPATALVVRPLLDSDAFGVLMPMRQGDEGDDVGPDKRCSVCRKLLAAGAPCPEHGARAAAEAERERLEKDADEILKNGGHGGLVKKELKGPAVARKKRGRHR